MRLKNKMSLKHVVFKGVGRESISEPYFDADKKVIVATDGKVMVLLPVDNSENDVSGHIPIEAISQAQKQSGILMSEKTITVDTKGVKTEYPRPDLGSFPQFESVTIPADKSKKVVAFKIDLRLLKAVEEAFGASDVVVEVPEDEAYPLRISQGDKLAYVMRMESRPC